MPKAVKDKAFLTGAVIFAVGVVVNIFFPGAGIGLMLTGGAMMMGAITAKGIPEAVRALQNATISGRDPAGPWRIIYGNARVGGVITFMHLSGNLDRFMNLVVTLAGHQIESVDALYLNKSNVGLSGGSGTGSWAGLVSLESRLGLVNQTVYTSLRNLTRPEWLPSPLIFNGIHFNGAGHYVDVPTTTGLNPPSTTIEFMIRPRAGASNTIMALGGGSAWKITLGSNNRVVFTDSVGNSVSTQSNELTNNIWFQISFTAGPGGLEAFINGLSQNTNGAAYNPGTGSKIMTWGSIDGTQSYWRGDLDTIRIFDIVRTQGAISGSTQLKINGPAANLIANWNMPEGSGVTVGDDSGNSHNATLNSIWTDNHLQTSRANVYVRLKWNRNKFSGGLPDMAFDVKGQKLLDPRTDQAIVTVTPGTDFIEVTAHGLVTDDQIQFTTDDTLPEPLLPDVSYWIRDEITDTFKVAGAPGAAVIDLTTSGVGNHTIVSRIHSDNPALCTSDFLMNPDYGFGVPYERVDNTTLAAAANVCDESVTLDAGGSEKRYTCNGVLFGDSTPRKNMESLLASMGGQLVYAGGRWYIYAAAWRPPTTTFDEDDVVSMMNIRTLTSRQTSFNAVKGIYQDKTNSSEPRDYPSILNSAYEAEDGKRVFKEMALPLTTSSTMAQRLAKIFLERARQAITVRLSMKLSAFQFQPPNTVQFTNARMGWNAKEFEISSGILSTQEDDQGVSTLVYAVDLRETGSAIYDWLSSEEGDFDPIPNTGLPNPFDVFPPEDVTVESGTTQLFLRLDGTVFTRARISWEPHDDDAVVDGGQIEVQFKKEVDPDWLPTGFISGGETEIFLLDVEDGISYDFQVRAISSSGVSSEFVQVLAHTIIGKTTPPADVVNFTALQNGTVVTFQWDQVSDIDLSGYEIRQGYLGDTWEDSIRLTETLKGTRVTDAAVSPSPKPIGSAARQPWQFFIKAIDTTLNESENPTGFQLVVSPPLDINLEVSQSPVWRGIKTNYTRNPIFGTLNPTDQDLAIGDNQDVFDNFVINPFSSSSYESAIFDTGFDDRTRVWMSIQGNLGAGETLGTLKPILEMDFRLDADAFEGFVIWSIGDVIARHYKFRFTQLIADGKFSILEFIPSMDTIEHVETVDIIIPAGGLEITFKLVFSAKPEITVTPPGALFAVFDGITTTGFTCFFLNASGIDVGGTGSYTATGA